MASLKQVAPIFPVHDLNASMAHYERLGFATREFEGIYGFATRDGIEFHLGTVPDDHTGTAAAYLYVDDSDELARVWRATGADVRGPEDTEWGQHEGVVIDPDGNVIRFGSPMSS